MKPFFTLSKSKVLQQFNIVDSVADITSYSSKTNPLVSSILEQETNCMFSIHTENELKNITNHSRILYLAQAWTSNQITCLLNKGITNFVVDNEPDLNILIETLRTLNSQTNNLQITLLLRTKLKENTLKTEKYFVFGMPSATVASHIPSLKSNPNIKQLGIHFHRKTQNMAEWNLQFELETMFPKEIIELVDIINIGGGLPSFYANTNRNVVDSIIKKIDKFKQFLKKQNIKLMLEPGRFIAAPAGKLHTSITRIYENNILVNASIYNTDLDAIIVPVKLLVQDELQKSDKNAKPYIIKGLTPCSLDLFRYRVYLKNPKEGDELVFLNAGAYNFASEFCDLEKLETKFID